jgi:CBS domain containing-hemolysin-like protein
MAADSLYIPLAFLLVALNAFFVAAEFAMVRVRTTRLAAAAEAGSFVARTAVRQTRRLDAFLSATQLGITFTSLGLGWVGEPAFAHLLEGVFDALHVGSPVVRSWVAFGVAFALITFLHIVVGELAPKTYAIRASERVAMLIAIPMHLFQIAFRPVLWLLDRASWATLRLFGVSAETTDLAHSEEELRLLLAESHRLGALSAAKRELLENVIDYTGRTARHVMVPRADIAYLSLARPLEENLAVVTQGAHTRFPLAASDIDHVVGMVHVKDLFHRRDRLRSSEDLLSLKREILFVPETRPLDALQKDFQQRRTHMAIVVDEYGGTSGMVTLENVIEEIVGEIQDEFDREAPEVQETPEGLVFDGLTLIDDAAERLGVKLPENPDVSTLGGLVAVHVGRIPRVGDRVVLEGYAFTVVEMRGRRVTKILAAPLPDAPDAAAARAR